MMNPEDNKTVENTAPNEESLAYEAGSHRYGRIYIILAFGVMIGVPLIMCLVMGVAPLWGALFAAWGSLSLLNLPGGFVEMATYAPLIGTDATYLAFVTGNLINLKVPCAANAQKVCKTEIGTEENEIVSTLAVGASTLVNCLVMTIGIILLSLVMPLLASKVIAPAFNWVIPALFGALGWSYFKELPLLAGMMVVFTAIIAFLLPGFANGITIYVIVCVVIAVGISFLLFKKNKI